MSLTKEKNKLLLIKNIKFNFPYIRKDNSKVYVPK